MKTGFIMDRVSRNAGGLFDASRRLAQTLGELGEQVAIFGVEDELSPKDAAAWKPLVLHLAQSLPPRAFGCAPGLTSSIAQFSPDVVHLHGLWNYPSLVAARWRRRTGGPDVIHPHGMLDPWALRNSGWKKRLAMFAFEKHHLQSAACIRALCASELRSIRALGLRAPVCVIPNGIDLPPNATWPKESRNTKTLLYLGRIHPKKGLVDLIRAWGHFRLTPAGKDWALSIAGWDQGGHQSELQTLASQLAIPWSKIEQELAESISSEPTTITFLGPRFDQDKALLYQQCDAFVLPSLSEGLPMVVLEAWGHLKPVVMTSMCNLPEGFAAGAAIQIDSDPEHIAQGLAILASMSADERQSMGAAARRLVESSFTWETVGQRMSEVNEWLTYGGAKPVCIND